MKPTAHLVPCLALCLFASLREIHAANSAKPNIVYILCDDLGYGDVRRLNSQHGKIATPQMDRMAEQGMNFTDAHSSSSVCTPTRYGILTGRYKWRTHLQSGVLKGYDPASIAKNRQGKWKLLLCAGSGGQSDPKPESRQVKDRPETQLYDLESDMGETKNVQAAHPEVVARLTTALVQIISNGRSTPGTKQSNDTAIQIRKQGAVTDDE